MVNSNWTYKIKHAIDGGIKKFKGRIVAREFSEREGMNYDEIFALVNSYTSIRTIVSLASVMGWKIHQMNVKTTFLNSTIDEEVYIEQPQGFNGKELLIF